MRRETEADPKAGVLGAAPEQGQAAAPPASDGNQLLRLAATLGNRAFTEVVLARQNHGPGGAVADPAADAPDTHADWETTPNLRGAPPVRDRHNPPNSNVVEDAGEYASLVAEAQAALVRQRARAAGYLDARGNLSDYRYFFAKVYSYVTENEIGFCESAAFYYPSYVLKCVLYFERIYDDNVKAFDRPGARVEDHWRTALEETAKAQKRAEDAYQMMLECRDPDAQGGMALAAVTESVLGAMSSLTVSMKAHIRYDLPRAEAWVFNQGYRSLPGVQQNDFMPDFMSMSGVFDRAGEAMLPDMAEKLGVPVDLVPRMVQDTSMNYLFGADMATERADTWRRALALGAEHPDDLGPYGRGPGGAMTGDTTQSDQMSAIGGLSDPSLRPSMTEPMNSGDDDSAHTDLDTMTDEQIAALPAVRRVQYLRALQGGAAIGDDETLVLRVLRASSADIVTVIDGADAWDLMYALDMGNATSLRQILRSQYYGATALNTALRLVRRCMDGETAEWEEEMVADIVVARGDRVALIREIGRAYPTMSGSDDFHKGLNKLEWQLDGNDETRVHDVLKGDSAAPASESGEWW
jgi:hypothetical protein